MNTDIKDILQKDNDKYKKIQSRVNGFTQIKNWFLDSSKFTIYEKMVLVVIKRHQINKNTCWPSIATIARKARCSKTTVNIAVKGLVEKNMIEKIKNNKVKSNVYKTKNQS